MPRFRPVPVFDVSQTNGKPLPQLAQDLTGDVEPVSYTHLDVYKRQPKHHTEDICCERGIRNHP